MENPKRRDRKQRNTHGRSKVMISREEAVSLYQRRSAELQFQLPDERFHRLLSVSFPGKTRTTEKDNFKRLMEFAFEIEMPEEHKDNVPLELLNLSPAWVYAKMVPALIVAKADGLFKGDEEVADLIISQTSKDLERAHRLEKARTTVMKSLDAGTENDDPA